MNWTDPDLDDFEDDLPPPRRSMSATGRLLLTALLLLMALLIAALVVRTRTGSEMIASVLRKQTGLDLEIGAASLGWPTDVVLKRVRGRTTQAYGAFSADEIRMGFHWNGALDLQVKGAVLEFVRTADGWLPEAFSRIAVLDDVRDTPGLFADAPDRLTLDIRDGTITWSTPDGEVTAFVKGLSFAAIPLETPGRRLRFYELAARHVKRVNGAEGHAVRRLWLSAPENAYAGIAYHTIWEGGSSTVRDWWSNPAGADNAGVTAHEK